MVPGTIITIGTQLIGKTNPFEVNAILVTLKVIKATERSKTSNASDFMGRASGMLSCCRKQPEAMEGTFSGGSLGFGHDSWGLLMLMAVTLTQGALQAVVDSRSSCISKDIFKKTFS